MKRLIAISICIMAAVSCLAAASTVTVDAGHPAKPGRESNGSKEECAVNIETPPNNQRHGERDSNGNDREPVAPNYLSKDQRRNLPARHGLSVVQCCDDTGRYCI